MKVIILLGLISLSLCQAAAPEVIERHEQEAEQIVPMEVDNAPINATSTIASVFKRPRSEERCIRKEQHPAKRRRIQTAEEAEEMALDATSQDNITLVSNDGRELVISKQNAFLSPTLREMATMPPETSEESATGEINFEHFDHDELYMLVDILSTLSTYSNETQEEQAEILNRKGIINRTNLTTAQNLADFFELPVVHTSLALLFIPNSGLDIATIKNKLSIKKYFESGEMDADFTGVSIQDLIDYGRIPKISRLARHDQRGISYRLLDLHNKHINSLEGLENIPDINTVQLLHLADNRLTALPDGVFDQLTQLTALRLDNNRLAALPNGIFNQLAQLEILRINHNHLTTLPNSIFDQLAQLRQLWLHNNQLTALPNGIFDQLTQLTYLLLKNNQLAALPDGIFNPLTQLTQLALDHNRLTTFPDGIFDQLTQLTALGLSHNHLTTLPNGIFDQLAQLTQLALHNNQLTALPNGIFDPLTQLTLLTLHHNRLTTLPNGIFDQLTQLTLLWLHNNQLTALPNGIFNPLTQLTQLALNNNHLTTLPNGIFDPLAQLTLLALNNNRLRLLPPLNHLNNLQELWLNNNPLPENTKQIIRQQFARLGQNLKI